MRAEPRIQTGRNGRTWCPNQRASLAVDINRSRCIRWRSNIPSMYTCAQSNIMILIDKKVPPDIRWSGNSKNRPIKEKMFWTTSSAFKTFFVQLLIDFIFAETTMFDILSFQKSLLIVWHLGWILTGLVVCVDFWAQKKQPKCFSHKGCERTILHFARTSCPR